MVSPWCLIRVSPSIKRINVKVTWCDLHCDHKIEVQSFMGRVSFSQRIKEYLGKQFNLPEDQVESMLPEFRRTLMVHLENLKTAQGSDDLKFLQVAAHTMKGALLNLGLNDCAELARQIETGAADRDTTLDYAQLVAGIDACLMDVTQGHLEK